MDPYALDTVREQLQAKAYALFMSAEMARARVVEAFGEDPSRFYTGALGIAIAYGLWRWASNDSRYREEKKKQSGLE